MKCYFREGKTKRIISFINERHEKALLVTGMSGVGKSTIISEAVKQLGFEDKVVSFSFKESNSKFKDYLNDLLNSSYQELPWYQRLINTDYKVVRATLRNIPPLSFSFVRKTQKRGKTSLTIGSRKTSGIIFESTPFRLNGRETGEFFSRFWKYLSKNNITIIVISNTEQAGPEDFNLIGVLSQSMPTNIKLIVEVGSLAGTEKMNKTREVIKTAFQRNFMELEINPFDEPTARRLFEHMKEDGLIIADEFNYRDNAGIPISIIFGISNWNDGPSISQLINSLLRKKSNASTLMLLTILYGLIDDYDTLTTIANCSNVSFEPMDLLNSRLVTVTGSSISLSHPLIQCYVNATKCQQLSEILIKVYPELAKTHPEIATFLRFHRANLFGQALDGAITKSYLAMLVSAIEVYDMRTLSFLLPLKEIAFRYMGPLERDKTIIIDAQYSIYASSLRPEHKAHSADNNILLVGKVLQLQQQYHSNEFRLASTFADNILEHLGQCYDEYLTKYLYSSITAIKGAALIALGDYAEAKRYLVESKKHAITGSKPDQYLLLLDSFTYGMEYLAAMSESIGTYINNPYIKAKFYHNLFSARLYTQFRCESLLDGYRKFVLEPFHQTRSREISYTLNNISVYKMLNGDINGAVELLYETYDRTFEVYDQITIINNIVMACSLLERFEEAASFQRIGNDLLVTTQFSDPAFISKFYLNSAILAKLRGDALAAEQFIKLVKLPIDSDDYGDVMSKVAYLTKGGKLSLSCNSTAARACNMYLFWPKIIHFWDFTIPIVDKRLLSTFDTVRSAIQESPQYCIPDRPI